MKVYSVAIEAMCNVVVLVDSEDEALNIAMRNVRCGDCELTTGGPADEINDDPEEEDQARATYIRHADKIFGSDGRELRPAQALQLLAS